MQKELIKIITIIKTWCCPNHYFGIASELLCLFIQITKNKRKAFTENTKETEKPRGSQAAEVWKRNILAPNFFIRLLLHAILL